MKNLNTEILSLNSLVFTTASNSDPLGKKHETFRFFDNKKQGYKFLCEDKELTLFKTYAKYGNNPTYTFFLIDEESSLVHFTFKAEFLLPDNKNVESKMKYELSNAITLSIFDKKYSVISTLLINGYSYSVIKDTLGCTLEDVLHVVTLIQSNNLSS